MSYQKKSKDQILNSSSLTVYGQSKTGKGFIVALTNDQTKCLKDFLNLLHGGTLRVFEVENLKQVSIEDIIKGGRE